jgi:hypothetical protein
VLHVLFSLCHLVLEAVLNNPKNCTASAEKQAKTAALIKKAHGLMKRSKKWNSAFLDLEAEESAGEDDQDINRCENDENEGEVPQDHDGYDTSDSFM